MIEFVWYVSQETNHLFGLLNHILFYGTMISCTKPHPDSSVHE